MSSSVAVQSALEANLAALGSVNADVVQALHDAARSPALDLTFVDSEQGVPAGALDGRQMCSKRRPLDEAKRLMDSVDLVENAVVVVLGFSMGYHVQALAERMGKAGVIIVYEPDMSIARAVLERVDHASWLNRANVIWITSETDRGLLAGKLKGVESVLAQGVTFVEHPPSRDRLGERSGVFSRTLKEFMDTARTVLLTQMVRAADTVRNMVLNLDHYVTCDGIADLKDAAQGFPAVVVSAGPSLRRNMHLLAQPGVRDRVVIIAVQTVLKPLLAAGIRPHFVTALDYHEISRRFYEGLTAEDVEGVTLVAEPKVHPAVLDAFPGKMRCASAKFLDELLGEDQRKGDLPAGTTVAHLAMYLADYLGCRQIAMIGQDLGFTDGLYYGPGTAIDEVWAPELNAFNTIEMMQWQRIVRHRRHLQKLTDHQGRPIYTDSQMLAYLQQFERDFSALKARGIQIIDASEGGVVKQHAEVMPLAEVLEKYATREVAPLRAFVPSCLDASPEQPAALRSARERVAAMRRDIADLRESSRRTHRLIQTMIADQSDQAKMKRHFAKLKRFQDRVGKLQEAFTLLDYLNQTGMFNRRKADRRLHMQSDLTPLQRQKLELQRDEENLAWIKEAADVMIDQLTRAEKLLEPSDGGARPSAPSNMRAESRKSKAEGKVAALVPIDPHRDGLGIERSLADEIGGRTVLQATLERLSQSRMLEQIILIVPRSFDVEPLIDRRRLPLQVEVEHCEGESPFGPEQRAIAIARLFSDTGWRGGIGGMTIYDEVLCPQIMHEIMSRHGLDAALIGGPDWPLIDVTSDTGCDAVVQRHLENPQKHPFVFTQSPPGMCGCVISTAMMKQLSNRNRLATIGSILTYRPHQPRADAIGTDANVQIDHRVRNAMIRATYRDSTAWQCGAEDLDSKERCTPPVHHLVLEVCTERTSNGLFNQRLMATQGAGERPQMSVETARSVVQDHAAQGDCVLTLAGVGDPLLHPQFDAIIRAAKDSGVRAVHVRTELLVERGVLDRLLASGVDVISIDLHADSPETYRTMMGLDRFGEVLENIQYLLENRTRLTDHQPTAAFALPWIVTRLQRCDETFGDLESFFDRWQHVLGTAVIEGGPGGTIEGDSLEPAVTPKQAIEHATRTRTVIFSDGTRGTGDMARLFLP